MITQKLLGGLPCYQEDEPCQLQRPRDLSSADGAQQAANWPVTSSMLGEMKRLVIFIGILLNHRFYVVVQSQWFSPLFPRQIEALQEVLEKLKSKQLPSSEKKLGWVPTVRTLDVCRSLNYCMFNVLGNTEHPHHPWNKKVWPLCLNMVTNPSKLLHQ